MRTRRMNLGLAICTQLIKEGHINVNELSTLLSVSSGTCESILTPLRRAGYVIGHKGRNGGYSPTVELHSVKVGEVMKLFNQPDAGNYNTEKLLQPLSSIEKDIYENVSIHDLAFDQMRLEG